MTASPKYGSLWKLHCRGSFTCRTRFPWREADVLGEEVSECIRGTWRGMGPSAYARIAEIMSGRAISQQGLATTCKDLVSEGPPRCWEGLGLTHEPVGARKEE